MSSRSVARLAAVRRSSTRVVAVLALLLLTGATAPAASAASAPAEPPGTAWVRAAHAVPGMAGMDITVTPAGGSGPEIPLALGAGYGTVSEYLPLPSGDYVATVAPPGEGSAPVLSGNVVARPGEAVTLAAVGTVDAPRLATLQDDLSPPTPGTARLRLLPASGTAPSVSVAAVGGPVIAQDAVFGQVTPYTEVPAGPWTLSLTRAGSGDATTTEVVVEAGSVYTVLVTDGAGGSDGALALLPITDATSSGVMPPGAVPAGGGGTADGASPAASQPVLLGAALSAGLLALLAASTRRRDVATARR